MICAKCAADGEPTRDCALCGETMCRHDARKQRTDDGVESIVCKEPFDGCLQRFVKRARVGE